MTVADIIRRARRILQDSVEPYRWEDAELREDVQLALRYLNSAAPHTRYVAGGVTDYTPLPDEDDEPIAVDERYAEGLALYVAYLAYFNDATDTVNNGRAESCLALAKSHMV